jgi:glutamate-1-semialdehyde 2,1-aminomutase
LCFRRSTIIASCRYLESLSLMPHRVERSLALYRRALELIPGGTQLLSRRPSRYASGVSPIYAARAQGARFWDVDGHEYIDWASGIGAIILGYCDSAVDAAVKAQIDRGVATSINSELELELAEELCRTIPCAEMVRYAKCGGEACAIAVRIARGATGRDKVLFCGYHGWHDWYLAANHIAADSLNTHLFPGIEPIGVPRSLAGTALPFPFGDLAALGQMLDDHRGAVAAVIMEPLRSELPPEGYLAGVRKLCDQHRAVLIFDEVSSGFRTRLGGIQEYVGVTPDLAVFAKSISNGYPMAAVVGKRDVMQAAGRMFISSTYWSDPIGLTAALTTIRELRRRNVPAVLAQLGSTLQQRLNETARAAGLPATCGGLAVHPAWRFTDCVSAGLDADAAALQLRQITTYYIQEMALRGCHGYAAFYLNAAQGAAEVEQTVEAAREVLGGLRDALDTGTLPERLECDLTQDVFRRLVR